MIESEKLASLGRVVAGVAHELNTPIGNALLGVTTLESDLEALQIELASGAMRRSSLGSFVTRAQEGLNLSHNNLQRAAHLIADFKQVAVDQTSDQRRRFDLAEVSAEILNMLQPTLRKTACVVERDLPAGLVCDSFPGGYGQVLTNLVLNAMNHAFEPGAPGHIRVQIGAVGDDQVEMVVSDDGMGMDENVRSRIFDPFFTTKMGRGGTGLGMNIVHGIVTRVLKGQVTVTSAPGQGTQIRVVLPRDLASVESSYADIA
jgi:two-component system NtrC family sensor kinase